MPIKRERRSGDAEQQRIFSQGKIAMSTQNIIAGAFNVNLVVDADGHLSIYVTSIDGSKAVDITDDMGGEDDVCLRVTTDQIESLAN